MPGLYTNERRGHESGSSSASSFDSEADELNGLEQTPIMYKRPARWVPGSGDYLSRHIVCAGDSVDRVVYVGMAKHQGGHILGMVVRGENICYIPWGGQAIPKDEFYVLENPDEVDMVWKAKTDGNVPSGALEGGLSEDGENLYVARVSVDGVVYCGKVHPSHGCCYIPRGGAEHPHVNYEVLCVAGVPCRIRV